jgi:hypothetical protein
MSEAPQLDIFDQPIRAPYAGRPGFKEQGGASQAAAMEIKSRAETVREAVLEAFIAAGPDGLTADEAAERVKEGVLTVRPRCSELLLYKLIAKTDRMRLNSSGKRATVMVAVRYLPVDVTHVAA